MLQVCAQCLILRRSFAQTAPLSLTFNLLAFPAPLFLHAAEWPESAFANCEDEEEERGQVRERTERYAARADLCTFCCEALVTGTALTQLNMQICGVDGGRRR